MNWLPLTVSGLNLATTSGLTSISVPKSKNVLLGCILFHACHNKSFFTLLTWADVYTGSASCTVICGYSHSKFHSRHSDHIKCLQSFWSLSNFFLCKCYRTDNCMRADICTAVTLDTFVRIPYRDINCDTTLLICCTSGWCRTVCIVSKCRYWQSISFLSINLRLDVLNECYNIVFSTLNFWCE